MFIRQVCHKSEKCGNTGGLGGLAGLKILRSPLKKSERNYGASSKAMSDGGTTSRSSADAQERVPPEKQNSGTKGGYERRPWRLARRLAVTRSVGRPLAFPVLIMRMRFSTSTAQIRFHSVGVNTFLFGFKESTIVSIKWARSFWDNANASCATCLNAAVITKPIMLS